MKEILIKRILRDPKAITRSDIDMLLSGHGENQRINSSDLKRLFLSIYDLNNTSELGQAHEGLMGRLNRRSNKRRNNKFFKRIKKDISHIKIYAEGDSWFQHPLIKDIIDQINKCAKKEDKKYAIYSSAMGGEWWINIIEDGDYLPEISKIKPEVILLSGGGNDIVVVKSIVNKLMRAMGI